MKIIDLTYDIYEGMTTFDAPWHPKVSIKQMGRHGFEGRETREVTFGTHTGTQVDAPLHFVEKGKSIDQVPIRKLIGPVTILNFFWLKEGEEVTVEMLKKLTFGPKILFNFGWGKNWGSRKFYNGYPFISKPAAKYLISKKVEMIALDTPSPDDSRIKLNGDTLGSEQDSPIHKLFLGNGIVLVEYVANLANLNKKDCEGWNIAAMPLKIKGADGSPARVFIFK